MNFDSFSFLFFVSLSLPLFHLFRKSAVRPFILAAINILFVVSFARSFLEAVPLLIFIFLGYVLLKTIQRRPSPFYLAVFVGLVLLLFIYFKRYTIVGFLPFPDFPYLTIGLSYILFRVIHLLIDAHDKDIKQEISLLNYVNFTCFFLSFVSGPIQRYQDFIQQEKGTRDATLSPEETFRAFSRIINGYIKIIFFAPFFYNNPHPQYLDYSYVLGKLQGHSPLILGGWYAFAIFSFAFKLYMNFSGYMDIVIGIGKLFYFKLPENFDRPYLSKNFLELWRRWHVTLADWFKIYLFNPLLKFMMHRWSSPRAVPYLGVVAYFFTFFVMGVWHGTTVMYVIYGLFLGLGVSVNKLYQVLMLKNMGKKKYECLAENPVYRYLSGGFAGSYFCVALTCLWMSLDQFSALFGRWSFAVLLMGFFLVGILLAVVAFMAERTFNNKGGTWKQMFESFFFKQFWLSLKLLFLCYVILTNINPTSEFIYQAF